MTDIQTNIEIEQINPIEELKRLNTYDATIPDKIIHSTDAQPQRKVRKGWFNNVFGYVQIAIDEGQIKDPDLLKEADILINKYTGDEFQNRNVNREDIDSVTDFINKVTV